MKHESQRAQSPSRLPGRMLVGALLAMAACSKSPTGQAASTKERRQAVVSASALPSRGSAPLLRHQLEVSAYAVTLAADDGAVYVLGNHGAHRFGHGGSVEHRAIELGDTPALGGGGIYYWLNGELRLAPLQEGPSRALASVPQAPRRLVASGERVVWEESQPIGSSLRSIDGSEPRAIYHGEGSIEALALLGERAYFVERDHERWRLGYVPLSGGAVRFSQARGERAPAMLAVADGVFFYDGPSSTVRRFDAELAREDILARDVICSPLAALDRVFCAQISVLFELPQGGGKQRLLAPKRPGTIAGLVATPSHVAWLLDTGANRAELEVLAR